jgi:ABC-type Na+ efflux pump permease subunit
MQGLRVQPVSRGSRQVQTLPPFEGRIAKEGIETLRTVAFAALLVGLAAAALDFSSGYELAGGDAASSGDPLVFAACLLVLGGVALMTGVAAILPAIGERTRRVGLAMEICGVAMAAVSAWAPIMAPLTDFAMLAVGGLMVLSGALMQRKPTAVPRV